MAESSSSPPLTPGEGDLGGEVDSQEAGTSVGEVANVEKWIQEIEDKNWEKGFRGGFAGKAGGRETIKMNKNHKLSII